MKLALVDNSIPVVVIGDKIADLSAALPDVMALPGEMRLRAIIAEWSRYADLLKGIAPDRPLSSARLLAPLSRPAKLLCAQLSYREGASTSALKPNFFLKSSTSVIGPGDTVELPTVDAAVFHHEAELAVVIGKRAKNVDASTAMSHVFGYTCFMDMSARGVGPGTGFQDKSYDTFGPMGPWIMTADEIADPHDLQVRLWVDGALRHDYPVSDIANPVPAMIAYASSIAALEPGDVLAMGVNHQGLGPIQDGETVRMEIEPIGGFEVTVSDPQQRRWAKGIDHGPAAAVRRLANGEEMGGFQYAQRIDDK